MFETIAQHPIASALIALIGLALVFGALLGYAAVRFKVEGDPLVEQIDTLLLPWLQALRSSDCQRRCHQQVPTRRPNHH